MGTRQRSQLPIRDSRNHLQNPNTESTIKDNKVPKDLKLVSSGKNRLKASNNIPPHLGVPPLTPLHRLRKFKEIRDRNIKKSSFGKAATISKQKKNKMSVDVEKDDTSKGRRSLKEVKGTKDQISNGTQENGDKINDISAKKDDENPHVDENREMNGSQETGHSDKPIETEAEKLVKSEAPKSPQQIDSEESKQIENEKSKQNEIEKSKQPESEKKSLQIENEQNNTDKITSDKEEQNVVQENEITADETKDRKTDNSKESNKKIEIEDDIDDEEIEVLDLDTDEGENRDTDYESFSNDEPQEKVKILRRSFRLEEIRGKAAASTTAPTSSTRASTSKQSVEKPAEIEEKVSSLSPETIRRIKSRRVEGRRSLWQSTGVHRKRKYDDNEDYSSGYGKKQASHGTPSVSSPGWKFISSPFTRFWTPVSSPAPGSTPYKSFSESYSQNDIEDSLAVNVDDKSLYNKLNDSEFDDISLNSTESTASNSSWRCNIM
ncbi:hypothetical protein O3M35_012644 [Rhynocoris fuscipes]|uniref:Uncharacterized protein n=1 Tax=Rhynocoris fuscipes TaxID=488301 RepID=A0AAW1CUJ7_9HEMI